jgi:hypothetical protein
MSLKASKAKLARASKDIAKQWEETRHSWRDQKAREFEAEFIAPLPDSISSAMAIIDELDGVLNKIKKSCE